MDTISVIDEGQYNFHSISPGQPPRSESPWSASPWSESISPVPLEPSSGPLQPSSPPKDSAGSTTPVAYSEKTQLSVEESPYADFLGELDDEDLVPLKIIASPLTTAKLFLSRKRNLAIVGGVLGCLLVLIVIVALSSSEDVTADNIGIKPLAASPKTVPVTPRESETNTASKEVTAEPNAAEPNAPAPTPIDEPVEPEPSAADQEPRMAETVTASVASERNAEVRSEPEPRSSRSRRYRSRNHREKREPSTQSNPTPVKKAKSLFGDNGPKSLPFRLSRDAVQAGMNSVARRVKKCSKKETRPIVMSVTIGKNGSVAGVSATGSFAGTEIGSCVARVVRTAKFPPARHGMTVKYPFHL